LLPVGTLLLGSEPDSCAALEELEVTVSGSETPADTLDAIGLLCPEPLFQARTAIDALEPGEVLEVLADDPAAEEDLTRFAKRAGHEMVAVKDEGDYKRFLIRRGA
jgi:tRNA 2-thiouridine synthesizing protein A